MPYTREHDQDIETAMYWYFYYCLILYCIMERTFSCLLFNILKSHAQYG